MQLENYALGRWVKGEGEGQALYNSINGELVATATSKGLDFGEMMDYARKIGGPALRKLTFQERGLMLKKLAFHLMEKKDIFYKVSWATGATKADSWLEYRDWETDRKSTRLNSSHRSLSRMPSSA